MIKRWRYKMAYKAGYLEHRSSRLVFLFMVIAFIALLVDSKFATEMFLLLALIFWVVYWISHILEKKFFPSKR